MQGDEVALACGLPAETISFTHIYTVYIYTDKANKLDRRVVGGGVHLDSAGFILTDLASLGSILIHTDSF